MRETNIFDFEDFKAVSACPGIINVGRRQGKARKALGSGLRYLQDKEVEKGIYYLDRNPDSNIERTALR